VACLDTTVFVDLNRPKSRFHRLASQKLLELLGRGEDLVTTRFNVAEMYVGVQLVRDHEQELNRVKQFLASLQVLVFHDRAAWLYAEASAVLRRAGRTSGDMDILIAATAMAAGHRIVTRNPTHFAGIPGLFVETY